MKHTSKLELYTECQEIVEETLKKLNIEYIQPEGTFYVFPKIPDGIDEMTFCKTMVKNFIVIVPGSAFGQEGFYRMSLCLLPENVKNIKKLWKNLDIIRIKPKKKKNAKKKVLKKKWKKLS